MGTLWGSFIFHDFLTFGPYSAPHIAHRLVRQQRRPEAPMRRPRGPSGPRADFWRTPRTFGTLSRVVEGVWGCSWALGLSTRDVRRDGTVLNGPWGDPWRSEQIYIKSHRKRTEPWIFGPQFRG